MNALNCLLYATYLGVLAVKTIYCFVLVFFNRQDV